MRFLRMLTNAVIAGALGAAYLTVLVLQLNPHVPLLSDSTWRWFTTLGLLYGVHLAVLFYVIVVVHEFFALDGFSPGWASVRLLAWMAAVAAALTAVLMFLNVQGFALALPEAAIRRMTTGAIATAASAVILVGIAVAHYSFGRRGSRVGGALFVMAAFASLALPLAARGAGTPPAGEALPALPPVSGSSPAAGPRVVMILLDGASLDYILPRAAEGGLPSFARILDGGASMYLATIRPTQPDPVWASVATGMYPASSGVRSAASYFALGDSRAVDLLPDHCLSHALVHLGFVREQPNTSASWRGRPIWSILARAGISVGLVRWPLTHPAPEVPGFVVSDRFHQVTRSLTEFNRAAHPPAALASLAAMASLESRADDERSPDAPPETPEAAAQRRDRLYGAAMLALSSADRPRFTAVRYEGLDTVGHHFVGHLEPRRSRGITRGRGITEEERRRYVQVIDRYYAFIDRAIDAALESLAPGDLLVVVSGFGMQRLNPLKRTLARVLGDPDFTGTHERAPDGFLLAYGTAVAPGPHQRGSIVDITPTLLYFLDLPVARDMDGYARTDLFLPAFRAERPIAFVPSYSR